MKQQILYRKKLFTIYLVL